MKLNGIIIDILVKCTQSSIYPRKSQISWHFIIPLNPYV